MKCAVRVLMGCAGLVESLGVKRDGWARGQAHVYVRKHDLALHATRQCTVLAAGLEAGASLGLCYLHRKYMVP